MNDGGTSQGLGEQPQQTAEKQRAEVGISIQVVFLLIMGLFFVLWGLLVIGVFAGALPYSYGSAIGLLLVLLSLYILTGSEPAVGEVTWSVVITSIVLAVIGVLGVFFPGGALSLFVGMLVLAAFLIGGIGGLVRLFNSKDSRARTKVDGILRQVTIASGVLFALEIIMGVCSLFLVITTNPLWTLAIVIFGISFFYLAWCVHKVNLQYRPELTKTPGT